MNIDALLPAFIYIPAVPFLMGTPERDLSDLARRYGGTRESYREESPQFALTLPAFEIAQTPVTNALYAAFVAATRARAPLGWRGTTPSAALLDHPVIDVSWEDARAFCAWLNDVTGASKPRRPWSLGGLFGKQEREGGFRLPTEAEWEHAARGTDGRGFPWGAEWQPAWANTRDGGAGTTTPVGAYPAGASACGCFDMCGGVWEWTASLDALYPYVPNDGRENPRGIGRRILRGGCYANPHGYARCACRFRLLPSVRNDFLGFRLARSS